MIYRSLILTAWVVLVTLVVGEALPRESAGWRSLAHRWVRAGDATQRLRHRHAPRSAAP